MLHLTLFIHYTSKFILDEVTGRYQTKYDPEDIAEEINPETPFSNFESDDDIAPTNVDEVESSAEQLSSTPPPTLSSPSSSAAAASSTSSLSQNSGGILQRAESREPYDPEAVFGRLFTEDDAFDFDLLETKTRGRTLAEVVSWCDVDHYNLLEKAVIYNSRTLVRMLLSLDEKVASSASVFGRTALYPYGTAHCFRGAVHLAAFLGCVDILQEFLKHSPAASTLRGPVRIRPVHGPPNDLFRIIGYSDFTKNPRLAFQMRWIRSHPNELPVHYAICGGYPIIMKMLMSRDEPDQSALAGDDAGRPTPEAHVERDALLANLVRQAASCASYNCLESLYEDIPDAIYARDKRGWLYVSSGFPHGIQFLKFLMERGFAIKLLNNIDGRNTVNALHVFYGCLPKPDGTVSKFTDLYDVSEMLLDLSVDVNMETTAFRSHNVSETPLHILIDHVNLALSSIILPEDGLHYDSKFLADAQQIYDDSIRDTICLILESGFDLEKHCYSLLKRLFMNRNFLKRYARSGAEKYLVRANYGLRNVYNTARLLLDASEIKLCPARREITPALYLIDTLRDESAVRCVFGDRRATQMFNNCLTLLFENGDSANVYPFFSKEDSYMASPLVHLCDLYIGHWCRRGAGGELAAGAVNFLETLKTVCEFGAHFTCYMYTRGNFFRHGAFDNVRKLFVAIHRQLAAGDRRHNDDRLQLLNGMTSLLARYGAEPVIEEYAFRKSHLPMTRKAVESKVFGQLLLLGLYSAAADTAPSGGLLIGGQQFQTALTLHLNLANHQTYYTCLGHAVSVARDLRLDECADDVISSFYSDLKRRSENVRRLLHITRLRIYECLKPKVKENHRKLPLPPTMLSYVFSFER